MLITLIADVRYSLRRLVARPGYALLAVLTLALGVGGTAATYGVARGVLFVAHTDAAPRGFTLLCRRLGLRVPELKLMELDPVIGKSEPDEEIQDLLIRSGGLNLAVDFLPGSFGYDGSSGTPTAHTSSGRANSCRTVSPCHGSSAAGEQAASRPD